MKLKYLGTAAAEGWPALFCDCPSCRKARELGGKNIRTRAQAVLDDKILIDFGPDTYLHVLRDGLKLHEIQHCIMTHGHSDHLYATDLMMKARPYAQVGKETPFHVYGSKRIEELYKRMREVDDDSENLDECVKMVEIEPFVPFTILDYRVTPLLAAHDPAEKCLIYLVEDSEGKAVLYGNDTAYFPEETWKYLEGKRLDIVSLDCTMGVLGDGATHMGYEGTVKAKERIIEMGCAKENTVFILNHFSHNCGHGITHEEMEKMAEKDNFLVAYDGFTVEA